METVDWDRRLTGALDVYEDWGEEVLRAYIGSHGVPLDLFVAAVQRIVDRPVRQVRA